MWLRLSVAITALSLVSSIALAQTGARSGVSTSVGPTSAEERALLWKEGKAAHLAGNHVEAVRLLQRLVDRYPSAPGYLDAHLLLGRSLLALGDPKAAVAPLKYFIQGSSNGKSPQADLADSARLALVKAQLALSKPREAYLLAEETLARAIKRKNQLIVIEALVAKGNSQIGLNQDARARRSLESARAGLKDSSPKSDDRALEGMATVLGLNLKARDCERFPSAKRLEEDQVRDQLDRRGDCLLEAQLLYKDLLAIAHDPSSREGTSVLASAFADYLVACRNPPDPVGNRSQAELKRYRGELEIVLRVDCAAKIKKAMEFAEGWKAGMSTASILHLEELARKIGKTD